MYTYCFNNPVNMSDPSGNWPTLGQIFAVAATIVSVALVAVAVIAAAPAVAGAVMSTALYYGATAGTANALATAASIGCAALAGGTALVGVNQTVETITGTNYVAKAIGEKNYDNIETAIMLTSAAVISIPQTTPYPSTGRSEPRNLNEQVGMNFARANADAGKVIFPYLHDTRMPGWLGWQKYQIYYPGTGVNIHYVGNRFIPIFFDFKFKE